MEQEKKSRFAFELNVTNDTSVWDAAKAGVVFGIIIWLVPIVGEFIRGLF